MTSIPQPAVPTHDDALTWRDLADALTLQQNAYIKNWEAHPEIPPMADGQPASYEQHQAGLLFTARGFAAQNAAAARFLDVAPPPDDGQHYPWEDIGDGEWIRYFVGTTLKVGDAEVIISGLQSTDGSITRSIAIESSDSVTADEARALADALIDAADELERLS